MERLKLLANHLASPVDKLPFIADPMQFLRVDELIPEELNKKRVALREVLEREIKPLIPEYYEKAEFPMQIIPVLRKLNIFGLSEPRLGCKHITPMEKSLVIFELARIDASVATFYAVQSSLAINSIEKLGSEEQKDRYLPKMLNLEMIGAWGLTEPLYGSDASSLQLSATPVEGGYLLNGQKRWIGNAIMSDIIVTFARNTTHGEVEGFIVNTKSKGVSVQNIERKLALRIVQNGLITYENVFVPTSEKLVKATNFATGPNVILSDSRMNLAWMPTGIMAGVYEHVVKFVRERVQFDSPIAAMQINQEKLVRITGIFQACFLMAFRLTQLLEQGTATIEQASALKAYTTYLGREGVRLGRELLGGNGIIIDNYVMKALVDMEVVYTYEGTYDINVLVAGRAITGVPAFKSTYKIPKPKK